MKSVSGLLCDRGCLVIFSVLSGRVIQLALTVIVVALASFVLLRGPFSFGAIVFLATSSTWSLSSRTCKNDIVVVLRTAAVLLAFLVYFPTCGTSGSNVASLFLFFLICCDLFYLATHLINMSMDLLLQLLEVILTQKTQQGIWPAHGFPL